MGPTVAVHATAVAIGSRGILIVGPSKSGKSRLALALIEVSGHHPQIHLVGDDRVLLSKRHRRLVARPHPRIAGFIERRGLGILSVAYRAEVVVVAAIVLGASTELDGMMSHCPVLSFDEESSVEERRDVALRWFDAIGATNASHPRAKAGAAQAGR